MNACRKPLSYPSANRVAITGLGAVCSLGNSLPEIVRAFLSGKSGAQESSGLDFAGFSPLVAPVKNLPAFKTDAPAQLARTMGKHLSLLATPLYEALCAADIALDKFDPGDRGFFAGMGMVDYRVEDLLPAVFKSLKLDADIDYDRFFLQGHREIYPLWPLGMLNNIAFCQASIHFGLRGENGVFCPHGDAGLRAVYEAASVLEEGRATIALAGGVSEEISPFALARAKLKGVIASPSSPAPFLGEAGAMLVLEPLSKAEERGARILGQIAGFGFACQRSEDGRFASREAICSAIRTALCDAGCAAESIDIVMLGSFDRNELEAVREVFGLEAGAPVFVAAPSAVGETCAAAPVLNTVLALSIPANSEIPPAVSLSGRGALLKPLNIGRILVNGISCEGACGSMIVETA